MFHELPLRYEYGKVLPLKLSNLNRMSYSEMLDMLVYKLECEIHGLFYCIPKNSLEIGLMIVEGDPDIQKMYDMAELYGLINLYIGYVPKNLAAYYFKNLSFDDYDGEIQSKLKSHEKLKMDAASMTFDELVSWEKEEFLSLSLRTLPLKQRRKDEPMGYNDRSLPGKSKNEFSNEVILDDGVSSPATTLSLLLKRKGKSRVKFTRMRAILKRSKTLSLRQSVRSNYGSLVNMTGLNEDVGDDDLKDTGCSCNNDIKYLD
nr:transposase, MuDR, MULE transposase domain protein [Tanacetum cinerariifolium]